MISSKKAPCRPKLVHRFLDGETDPQESQWVRQHLEDCPGCQKAYGALQRLSRGVISGFEKAQKMADFALLEKRVLEKLQQRSKRRFSLSLGKILIPVTAAALIFGFVLGVPAWQVSQAEPSAIVSSFAGETSSIMVFETPETHRTIIWFSETADPNVDQSRAPQRYGEYRTT